MIVLMVLAMTSIQAVALTSEVPHDTIYFYNTWEQMFNEEPVIALVDPWIETITPYDVVITTDDSRISDRVVAATLGDSIWLINTHYLRQNFGGDAKKLSDFVPLYFNEKVAFVVSDAAMSVKDILFGPSEDYYPEGDYFYIDFQNRKVLKVTPTVLSALLATAGDWRAGVWQVIEIAGAMAIYLPFIKVSERAARKQMELGKKGSGEADVHTLDKTTKGSVKAA